MMEQATDAVLLMVKQLHAMEDLEKIKTFNDKLQYVEGEADNSKSYAGETYVIFGRDFTGGVTHAGSGNADVLTGTAAANSTEWYGWLGGQHMPGRSGELKKFGRVTGAKTHRQSVHFPAFVFAPPLACQQFDAGSRSAFQPPG